MSRLEDLQAKAGATPWSSTNPDQKRLTQSELIEWVILKGMPAEKAHSLSLPVLEKCYYTHKHYFDVVAGLRPKKLEKLPDDPFDTIGDRRRAKGEMGKTTGINQFLPQTHTSVDDHTPNFPVKPLINPFGPPIKPITDPNPAPIIQIPDLDQIERLIEQKLQRYQNENKADLNRSQIQLESSLETQIESSLKTQESKILELVKTSAEEIVFQSLRKKHQTTTNLPEQLELDTDIITPPPPADSSLISAVDPNFYLDPFVSRVLRKALSLNRNVFISGDTGCGKTSTITQICAVLNQPLYQVNCYEGITKEFFIGKTDLKSSETGTITEFQYGILPRAMREGIPILINEMSFLPPNLTGVLFPVLEHGGKMFVPETGEFISPAAGFCVFATDNTGGKGDNTGQYAGTEVQNTALLDRFSFKLKMTYLPREKEEEMLHKRFQPGKEYEASEWPELNSILSLAYDIRKAFSRGELSITFSTRKLIDYFEQRENGFSQIEALDLCLLSWLDEDDETWVKTTMRRLQIRDKEE